jgi:hypothetical protein
MIIKTYSSSYIFFLQNKIKSDVVCLSRRFFCIKKSILTKKKKKTNTCVLPPHRDCGRVIIISNSRVWVEGLVGVKKGERVSFGYPSQNNIPIEDNFGVVKAAGPSGALIKPNYIITETEGLVFRLGLFNKVVNRKSTFNKNNNNDCVLPPLRDCGRVIFISDSHVWVEGLAGVKVGECVSFGYPSRHHIPIGDNLGVVRAAGLSGALIKPKYSITETGGLVFRPSLLTGGDVSIKFYFNEVCLFVQSNGRGYFNGTQLLKFLPLGNCASLKKSYRHILAFFQGRAPNPIIFGLQGRET